MHKQYRLLEHLEEGFGIRNVDVRLLIGQRARTET